MPADLPRCMSWVFKDEQTLMQVSKIFEWVSEMLRDPSRTYELISPARRPLAATAGTVAKVCLLSARSASTSICSGAVTDMTRCKICH